LDIEVEGSADAECSGNTCTAEASGSAKCEMVPGATGGSKGNGVPLLALVLAIGSRRIIRRRPTKR